MFTLFGTLKASRRNRYYAANEKYDALIFVIAEDLPGAREKAKRIIRSLDWKEIHIEKNGEMFSMPFSEKDETFKKAFSTAQEKGFAMIVNENPVKVWDLNFICLN